MTVFTFGWHLPGLVVITTAALWLSVIDGRSRVLPRRIIYTAALAGLPWLVTASLIEGEPRAVREMVTGAAWGLIGFGAVHLITGGSFGLGDVRLATLLGATLGWVDPRAAPLGLLAGLGLAALWAVRLLLSGRARATDSMPLGPFLCAGAALTVFWLERS